MNMKNVLIGVFATTTVIFAGFTIYLGITLSNEVEKNAQLEALTAQEEVEVKEETESQNINEEEYSRIFKFSDEINVVNVQDRNYTTITRSSSAPLGVGATIENDSIVCLSLEKIENDMSFDVEKYDYYPRIDFGDRKVQNVYNTGPGGTGYGFFILFLMQILHALFARRCLHFFIYSGIVRQFIACYRKIYFITSLLQNGEQFFTTV